MSRQPEIVLEISGQEFRNVETLEVVRDMYNPAGSWKASIGLTGVVEKGALVRIYLDGIAALVGTVGNISRRYTKTSDARSIGGASLMGLLATSCITDFGTPPQTIPQAVERYLKGVPYVSGYAVKYCTQALEPATHSHASDVGNTVFKLLSEYARNRGCVLWGNADGTMEFGRVVSNGKPTFRLDRTMVEEGGISENSDQLHDEVILVSDSEDEGHKKVSVKNELAPLRRPFVACYNGYSSDLKKQAADYIRQEKMQALQLDYLVPGFSQAGRLWDVNHLVSVSDDLLGMEGSYVSHRVVYSSNRSSGCTSRIQLGPVLEDPFTAFLRKGRKIRKRGGI